MAPNSRKNDTDLAGFQELLLSRKLARENQVQYYTQWVHRFLWLHPDGLENLSPDCILAFRRELETDVRLHDWQIRQAESAVTIYLYQYLGLQLDVSADYADPVGDGVVAWRNAVTKVREAIRLKHYSYRTEQAYLRWIQQFARYVAPAAPGAVEDADVVQFLTHLALKRRVSSSTQNQAFCALLFLFRHVLGRDIEGLGGTVRAKRGPKLPVVLTREEVQALLQRLQGRAQLMARLIYGAGLRLRECLRLRVKDLDFGNMTLVVRAGKGDKDRSTFLPAALVADLQEHLAGVQLLHQQDLDDGLGEVAMPTALARKYPNAAKSWAWQYVFPADNLSREPRTGRVGRHHSCPDLLQRALRKAAREAGIVKRITVHCLRHSFATHLLEAGTDIRKIQELLGHKNVQTTMVYTHVVQKTGPDGCSPLDTLDSGVAA